jgi:hypothetical protein
MKAEDRCRVLRMKTQVKTIKNNRKKQFTITLWQVISSRFNSIECSRYKTEDDN